MSRTESQDEAIKIPDVLPVLPLKDAVVFPYIILPLSVGRDKSVLAVDRALAESRVIMLAAQRDGALDNPGEGDLHEVGTAAVIMRMLKLPDGRIRILVQGLARARVKHISQLDPYLQAKIERLEEPPPTAGALEIEALVRSVKDSLDRAVTLGKGISPEVMVIAANLEEPGRLADLAASNLDLKLAEAQDILETVDVVARLRKVSDLLAHEIQVLTMQQEISSQARGEIDRSQREYFLRQQLKAIQQELGEGEELGEEIAGYRQLADDKKLSKEGREELERQIRRLERSHPESAETQIIRTYLDWLTALPWETLSEDDLDLAHAQQVLDDDHYDLEKIKERILEYLAVRKLKSDTRGPILCFVGPPGVGKTSLGRSIARSLGRRFVRLSLGGVRDEAEIRGHRRTYVGALPGRILQGIRQAGTSNPVFVLDEIDKIGADFRGDPSSALLEVLDPEQNWSFVDHYLGLAYDLSRVLFIATANMLEPIQPAFLDRMEVIRLTGYTEDEKLNIAERHLVPKQMRENGVTGEHIVFSPDGIRQVISGYTKEAGLRNLERELAAICRKVAVRVARGEAAKATVVAAAQVEEFLGPRKHFAEELLERDRVGVATGLAWTAVGGDLLFIEVVAVPGKGQLLLTGQLGDVMKESAQAALSYARSWAGTHELAPEYFSKHDIHIHVPAGSIPKDGPSAGITIGTAIMSVLTAKPVNRRVAMTGEITLRGDVLPIGGLKEKVLAAKLAGVHTVIVPKLNQRDLAEVPETIKKGLAFHFVEHMDEVLELALQPPPKATTARQVPAPAAARRVKAPAAAVRPVKPPAAEL
ncbi:MAG TPA: endopeptidase La [Thermoanaerobaculia bacterium]|jgi:ATP-dependent Lon protease|nr:endopeptidase La [Thermoanaerobaculia bacterium]